MMDFILQIIQDVIREESLEGINFAEVENKLNHSLLVIPLEEMLEYVANMCHNLSTMHSDYDVLAARLELASIYYTTHPSFLKTICSQAHQLSESFISDCDTLGSDIDLLIDENKDKLFSYTALRCLKHGFLLKNGDKIVERPQHLFMRTAIQLYRTDKICVKKMYFMLADQLYIHATPTLMNAGKRNPQLASCFLCASPSIDNFHEFLKKCHIIMEKCGGIGCYFHKIPCENFIACIKMLESTLNLVKSKSDITRLPNCAVYLEPFHASVIDFLELKMNSGNENKRARDLFYALWVPDLFMRRAENDEWWSLFDPSKCPGLEKVYGEQFEELYTRYENDKLYTKRIKARQLATLIAKSQIETGGPYVLFKDTCNRYSMYPEVIEGSNLCAEIIEYSSENETAVCNLASISLPRCVKTNGKFNYSLLKRITKALVNNLNAAVDSTWYPTECARRSNMKYRPIGIGAQGLADVFQMMGLPFDCPEARSLNKKIYSVIYHTALEVSCELAKYHNLSVLKKFPNHHYAITDQELLNKIATYGLYNTLLVAQMPTATTSVLLGNCESIEPFTSNFYTRKLVSGDFYAVNKHLLKVLIDLNLWNKETRKHLLQKDGSVQELPGLADKYKMIFRTVWEIPQRSLIDMASDRSLYIDQSQSLNIFFSKPTISKVTSMLNYTWKKGLKTGLYYLRTKPASKSVQFTIMPCIFSCSA